MEKEKGDGNEEAGINELAIFASTQHLHMKSGPIILVEDDADDEDIFEEVLKELKVYNKIVWFINAKDAMEYLKATSEQPFIIFCDINLPGLSGIEMKRKIDADKELRRKSIPFVFYSTAAD